MADKKALLDKVFRPGTEVLHQRADEETLLIQLETNQTYALNSTASRFWELLIQGHTGRAAACVLAQEFRVSLEEATAEATALLDQLIFHSLLEG